MRVLLVNNGLSYPKKLASLFPGAVIEVLPAALVPRTYPLANHDCIVMSGSNNRPIPYHRHEINELLNWIALQEKPLIGVCYGAELIVEAYSGTLHHIGPERKYKGFYTIAVPDNTWQLPSRLCVYEAHQWIIESVAEPLLPVLSTDHGVLLFHHRHAPQVGVMFHPEKFTHETDGILVWQKIMQHLGLPLSF